MAAASEANVRRDDAVAKQQQSASDGGGAGQWSGWDNMIGRTPAMDSLGNRVVRIKHPGPDKPFKQHTVEEYVDYLAARGIGSEMR